MSARFGKGISCQPAIADRNMTATPVVFYDMESHDRREVGSGL